MKDWTGNKTSIFYTQDGMTKNSPNFQSIYVCNKMLDRQIQFSKSEF